MDPKNQEKKDSNRDPITGEPGAHPVGVGAGTAVGGAVGGGALGAAAAAAAASAATGATAGSVAGPVGTVVGAVAGGIAGAFAGKAIAEKVNPTEQDAYWRGNYHSRPYVEKGTAYDEYEPAFRYGWESRPQYEGRRFDDVETNLQRDWAGSQRNLDWAKARYAVRDAWDRIDQQRASEVGPGNSRIKESTEY